MGAALNRGAGRAMNVNTHTHTKCTSSAKIALTKFHQTIVTHNFSQLGAHKQPAVGVSDGVLWSMNETVTWIWRALGTECVGSANNRINRIKIGMHAGKHCNNRRWKEGARIKKKAEFIIYHCNCALSRICYVLLGGWIVEWATNEKRLQFLYRRNSHKNMHLFMRLLVPKFEYNFFSLSPTLVDNGETNVWTPNARVRFSKCYYIEVLQNSKP